MPRPSRTETVKAGQAYLEKNRSQPGVSVTPSGLQIEVLQKGQGPNATLEDNVKVHYAGRLIDGTLFDSSYERGEPAIFPVGAVIEGWVEALQLMNAGTKCRLVIPSELAYGEMGAGEDIGPDEVLVFEVELLEILG
jgi:FKBP-type peptidyl-prolyl cis-trans isomerase